MWMDLEMTGLDPAKDVILEIATLVTDDDLNILAEGPDLVVHQADEHLGAMDPFVVDMHTRSGLLNAVRSSTVSLEEAGAETLAFIRAHVPISATVPLCGNSIGTDRRFLAAYLPEIEAYLHYRSVDVSSVKELVRRWYPAVRAGRPTKSGRHRALDDIRDSVDELRYYREHVFVPRSAGPDAPTAPPHLAAEGGQQSGAGEQDQEGPHGERTGDRGEQTEATGAPSEHEHLERAGEPEPQRAEGAAGE